MAALQFNLHSSYLTGENPDVSEVSVPPSSTLVLPVRVEGSSSFTEALYDIVKDDCVMDAYGELNVTESLKKSSAGVSVTLSEKQLRNGLHGLRLVRSASGNTQRMQQLLNGVIFAP
ncbi:hypothetical protein AGDE_14603 [Angomonas deanei]|uniref:Uncharacterized protein n=1 Tax=Angomonas deanei TaxID=59799 RepID=A0A7G2CQK0_9TRYP|nr:hypothetical protein AGDE_14603 [Angomonas deanei]CAD2222050.1 hypothetical protein, conserved [Angomonas deanei]|eukprot:EPY20556.1 hypothetical protein AGDE_14603 [Angomonas deanei]